jgi:precorrin-3B methylase
MTTIAAGPKYYICHVYVVIVGGKEKEREKTEKKKLRKCECVRAHTTYTHRIDKKKREKGAACSLARSSIVRDSFLQASAQAQMAMYVSR